jgi:hypothetical protein
MTPRRWVEPVLGPREGSAIYRQDCASCHGPAGEGVAGKADEALYGEKGIPALARYIREEMPEDNPGSLSQAEAEAVAAHIHDAFYSAEARARNHPPRVTLAHLTARQYQVSLADLLGSFRPERQPRERGGLAASYHDSDGMNRHARKVLARTDASVDLDLGPRAPLPGMKADQFAIDWNGSVFAPDDGDYGFRLTTPNGARLYVNTTAAAHEPPVAEEGPLGRAPTIDLNVSSRQSRAAEAHVPLLGGRWYPFRLNFFKFKDKSAALRLEWRPPGGVWSPIPPEFLSPSTASRTDLVDLELPADDASLGYERGTGISRAWVEAMARGAFLAAARLEPLLPSYAGYKPGDPDRAARLRDFCLRVAERAYRRPLDPARRAPIERIFAEPGSPEHAARRALVHILSSPHFLYPEITGSDGHAVAGRLALALWDSLPDQALLAAAAKGELATPDQVRAHARRMMGDPRARAKLREALHRWLHVEVDAEISKDPAAHPGFDNALVADLRASLDRFVESIVWSDTSDYRRLLLDEAVPMNRRLAAFYGQQVPDDGAFHPVRLDPGLRAGVLTHPYLLSSFAYHKSTSPIHRGVFLTRNILGRTLRPPPMAIAFMDDSFDPSLTMREKVSQLTGKPACMSCHVTINPLGFSFERFDAVGRIRAVDNAKPVDDQARYTDTTGAVHELRGARDVALHAADSADGQAGFVRSLFHSLVKQEPGAYGPDTLRRLGDRFRAERLHVRHLATEIAVLAALHDPAAAPSAK